MRTITVKIPPQLDKRLTKFSKKRGTTRSAVLRDAVSKYLEESHNSFADQAEDLSGSLTGPKDLSSNKSHMYGYGQ